MNKSVGRKISRGGGGATKKKSPKTAPLASSRGGGNEKKTKNIKKRLKNSKNRPKIALLSLYPLYLYYV